MTRGHSELNQGPIDLQSIALPLSYTPSAYTQVLSFEEQVKVSEKWKKVYVAIGHSEASAEKIHSNSKLNIYFNVTS